MLIYSSVFFIVGIASLPCVNLECDMMNMLQKQYPIHRKENVK